MTVHEYLKSGEYLPKIIRDFHDQKRLFKRIWQNVENKKRQNERDGVGNYFFEEMTWTKVQVFVIDFFLWFMALHGYTLQKSRKQVEFYDFDTAMKAFDKEQMELFKAEFAAMRSTPPPQAADRPT